MPKTFKIIITGQVQGVGFRPFVFRLAKKHQLNGEVFNNELGVIIHLNSSDAQLNSFLKELLQNPPGSSIIISHVFKTIENKLFSGFKIIKSKQQSQLNLPLTPDFAICSDCKSEIEDPDNKRYKYPFTTCVNCGPRYAITKNFLLSVKTPHFQNLQCAIIVWRNMRTQKIAASIHKPIVVLSVEFIWN